jgi:MYXO-CTERM domain-containing protein
VAASDAFATHDGGSSAILRALVGEPVRYAIFQHENLNFVTTDCRTFTVVDLGANTWREEPLAPPSDAPIGPSEEELDPADPTAWMKVIEGCVAAFGPAYKGLPMHAVGSTAFATFHQFTDTSGCEPDCENPPEGEGADPRPKHLRHLKAEWKRIEVGKSQTYAEYCGDGVDDDGRLLPEKERCEAFFRGKPATWQLSIRDTRAGTTFVGTSFTVEPTELGQVLMGLDFGGEASDEIQDVGAPIIALMHLQSFETKDHVFIFGSVAHEPTANGTYFPVAAIVPKRVADARPPYASPRGCACEAGGGTPFGALGGAALVLLFLAARARRSHPHSPDHA